MPSTQSDKDGQRSSPLHVIRNVGLAAMILYGVAIMIGRFMHVNVVMLTITGFWNLLVGLFNLVSGR